MNGQPGLCATGLTLEQDTTKRDACADFAPGTFMPRYHFDILNGSFARDSRGQHLASLLAARTEALILLSKLSAGSIRRGEGHPMTLKVRDESGAEVYEAAVLVVEKEGGHGTDGPAGQDRVA